MDIHFRAKKILGSMDSYVQQHEARDKLGAYADFLSNDTLEIYVNDLQDGNLVLVNESGIAVFKGGSLDETLYSDILKIKTPPKDASTGVTVTLKDGSVKFVPVANGRGQFRDVYEFTRFLMRATETVRSRQERGAEQRPSQP